MKREIFCQPCALKLGAVNPDKSVSALDAAMSAQEKVIKVYGILRNDSACDFCGSNLEKGKPACCQSIVPMGGHYYEWENDYIQKGKPNAT